MLGRRCRRSARREYDAWTKEARKFGKAIWDITGKGNDVDMVFEHPGEATFPVSCLVVKRGGMVVFCAGTTGYNITFDARYVWMRQKRIQGSHFANLLQASQANRLVVERRIDPCMSRSVLLGRYSARAHQDVEERASARQHGGAGERAAHRACAPSRMCSRQAARCMAARSSVLDPPAGSPGRRPVANCMSLARSGDWIASWSNVVSRDFKLDLALRAVSFLARAEPPLR